METSLGVEAARKRLPELLERAAAGERIVIQRHRTPMAALVPLAGQAPTDPSLRQLGPQPTPSGPTGASSTGLRAARSEPGAPGCAGKHLQPLMQGIAAGYWIGVVSSVSLIRVLEGPLACGDEALAQRYARAFENPIHWQLVPVDAAIAAAAVRLRRQEPQLDDSAAIELATAIQADAAVLVTDHPALAQTGLHPVLSAMRL
ncbi:type II toxin-antitoxin system Phd/YefM family antitoxin [Cyanobium sp. BA20m-14]|nr:type II toxin-antitoxin system Phd/YefM family antitoxin [Cyanobium sp. BA20m-14]